MNVLVILAHPEAHSFNYGIAKTVTDTLSANNHTVIFHDLYKEKFNPLLYAGEIPEKASLPPVIKQHSDDLQKADGIVIIHPNWWGQPPAILKGWIDRVIRPGIAYRFIEGDNGEGVPLGLLKAKTALVFNTSNTPAAREDGVFGDPLETIWKNCILKFCGIENVYRKMFRIMVTSTPEQRKLWLNEIAETVNNCF